MQKVKWNKNVFESICDLFDQKKDEILYLKEIEQIQLDYIVQGTADAEIKAKVQESFKKW